ncbi:MAG: lactate utilization protein [Lachnospiraceae bacterium]|nr:lactate utilization protein [Lachnospiraceae bacterium]
MKPKKSANELLSNGIIDKFKTRGFDGYYCRNCDEAVELIKTLIPDNSSVAWGGSETLKETGIFEMLKSGSYNLLDRSTAKTPEEQREMYAKHVMSDVFLMSSNAITMDGELVNIDGNGNRVACLITGPKSVIVVAGINKISYDINEAVNRIRNIAAPPNAIRLDCNTPCKVLGKCGDCMSDDCMCCHLVVTRTSRIKGRIKIILINETLGY